MPIAFRSGFATEFHAAPPSDLVRSGRDAFAPEGKNRTPSIVPGGGDGFSRVSSSPLFRNQSLASSFSDIDVQGESGTRYKVRTTNDTLVRELYAVDQDTDGAVPTGRYVQKNDQGQWVPAEHAPATAQAPNTTPVRVANDPTAYVITNPSNMLTPQQLYTQPVGGYLKQTPKQGIYVGGGEIVVDTGLVGGGQNSSKGQSSNAPFSSAPGTSSGAGHSFSDRGAWGNSSTTSTGSSAPLIPPKSTAGSSSPSSYGAFKPFGSHQETSATKPGPSDSKIPYKPLLPEKGTPEYQRVKQAWEDAVMEDYGLK